MEYSELIKNFETIRAYLRDFYIFGFRTRNEFTGRSARKYDNERRRAEDWLRGAMSFHATESGKSYFISADSRVIPENPLYKAFKNKSFTANDIALHFYILDALGDTGGGDAPLTQAGAGLRDIAERVAAKWQSVPGAPDFPDEATLRNKLNEYARLGLVSARREKRSMVYSLRPAKKDLEAYRDAIAFASEALPLGVIGSFLLDRMGSAPALFSYKHRYLPGALDSEVLLALLACRNKNACARIASRSPRDGGNAAFIQLREQRLSQDRGSTTENKRDNVPDLVFPLRFYLGTQTGRDYLLAWSPGDKRARAYRLDRIAKVTRVPDDDPAVLRAGLSQSRLDAMADALRKTLWGVSLAARTAGFTQVPEQKLSRDQSSTAENKRGNAPRTAGFTQVPEQKLSRDQSSTTENKRGNAPRDRGSMNLNKTGNAWQHVSMTIHAGPDEGYIVQRLQREKRCGTVTRLDAESWRFDADVYDAMELLPWLRTFIGRVVSLACGNPEVTRRFHEDLAAMLQLYGVDGDAV